MAAAAAEAEEEEDPLAAWERETDDDAFVRQYRERRLRELQAAQQRPAGYGSVRHVSAAELLAEIDGAPPSTFVVIHLYQEVGTR